MGVGMARILTPRLILDRETAAQAKNTISLGFAWDNRLVEAEHLALAGGDSRRYVLRVLRKY
jgi:hypothetical protein